MKHLFLLLLVVVSFHVPTALYAQGVTLSVKDASLENVFKEIRKQTGYNFLYASQLVAQVPKVTIQINNASIEQALDLVFKGMKLEYEINDRTIVIRAAGKSLYPKDKRGALSNKNGGVAREGHVAIKISADTTIIILKEDFELCKIKNGCLLFMSSLALGDNKNPMQNKRIREIKIVQNGDELVVYINGANAGQIKVLQAQIDEVKIVMLTDLKRTSAKVLVAKKYSSGVKHKTPVIKKEV